jgi:hypothetical protein
MHLKAIITVDAVQVQSVRYVSADNNRATEATQLNLIK